MMKPLGNRIILRRSDAKEVTDGGILLVGRSQEKPAEGTILAIGPGNKNSAGELLPISNIEVGNKVLFVKSAGTDITVNGDTVVVLTEHDILGVLDA